MVNIEKNTIYGIVGVNNSGKTTMLNEIIKFAEDNKIIALKTDFSDGIRSFAEYIMNGECSGDCFNEEEKYIRWKNGYIATFKNPKKDEVIYLSGRDILERIGEGVKIFTDDSVWSTYTKKMMKEKIEGLDKCSRDECSVVFGSVRFASEVYSIVELAVELNKPFVFLFCNYNNAPYREFVHSSEKLGNELIKFGGINHGDCVNNEIRHIINQGLIK